MKDHMENIVQIELKSILAIGVPANWDRGDPNNRIDPQETKLYIRKLVFHTLM